MKVCDPSPAVAAMRSTDALIDSLLGGTDAMRAAGRTYLPQWPAEDDGVYKDRLATATLFPAFARTISVLTGKPFSKPVTIGDTVPARIAALLPDVDMEGRNLDAFATDVFSDALAYGRSGILVDCPPNGGARTIADERKAGIRPYLVHIAPGAVLGCRHKTVGGAKVLTQLRLLERVEEDDGAYGVALVEQVRVLTPGAWETWRKVKEGSVETWRLHEDGTTSLNVIPFVPVYGRRTGFMTGRPPMLELAHSNVEHWQSKSDQQTILHVARIPVLFAKGLGQDPIVIATNYMVKSDGEHADLKYVEHSGKAIEAGRLSLLDLEDRMRQIGAELLIIKPGNTTVAQTVADNEPAMCDLARITVAVEDALDQALHLMARFMGEADGGNVSLYKDFGAASIAEASADLLLRMHGSGALSSETLLAEFQRRDFVSADIDVAQEIDRAKADAAARILTTDPKPPALPSPGDT